MYRILQVSYFNYLLPTLKSDAAVRKIFRLRGLGPSGRPYVDTVSLHGQLRQKKTLSFIICLLVCFTLTDKFKKPKSN